MFFLPVKCVRRLHLPVLDMGFWADVGALPELQDLIIHHLTGAPSVSSPGQPLFLSLGRCVLLSDDLGLITHFIACCFQCKMTAETVQTFYSRLSTAFTPASVTYLGLSHSAQSIPHNRQDDYILGMPLLRLPPLRHRHLRSRSFLASSEMVHPGKHCPLLIALELSLMALVVPPTHVEETFTPFTHLLNLGVVFSPIHSPHEVATFLAALCPHLYSIAIGTLPNPEEGDEADMNHFCLLWQAAPHRSTELFLQLHLNWVPGATSQASSSVAAFA
ncbi:hypothetical protein C8J57DRAFT_1525449 [Mycena rebaudengoi]|nr:hypothetical protein C8J57DRAFT_1525449 [Mycena rebaudengoi]